VGRAAASWVRATASERAATACASKVVAARAAAAACSVELAAAAVPAVAFAVAAAAFCPNFAVSASTPFDSTNHAAPAAIAVVVTAPSGPVKKFSAPPSS